MQEQKEQIRKEQIRKEQTQSEKADIRLLEEQHKLIAEVAKLEVQKKRIEEQEKDVKESLKDTMKEYGVDTFSIKTGDSVVTFQYRKPSKTTRLDSKALKAALPDVYAEYSKESTMSDSLTVRVKA